MGLINTSVVSAFVYTNYILLWSCALSRHPEGGQINTDFSICLRLGKWQVKLVLCNIPSICQERIITKCCIRLLIEKWHSKPVLCLYIVTVKGKRIYRKCSTYLLLCVLRETHLSDHVSFDSWLRRQTFSPVLRCHFFLR